MSDRTPYDHRSSSNETPDQSSKEAQLEAQEELATSPATDPQELVKQKADAIANEEGDKQ
jgi:hypothetical protein